MIAYIESPFQLICLNEFLVKYDISKIYIRNSTQINDFQINNTLRILKIKETDIDIIWLPNPRKLFSITKWARFIVRNIFKPILFGASKSKIRRLFFLRYELDDGTFSLDLIRKGKTKRLLSFFHSENFNSAHNFETLSKLVYKKDQIISESKFILGQKLSEIGFITEENYLKIIKAIVEKRDNTITYIAHRGEQEEKLKKIQKICQVQVPELPIELHLLSNNFVPSEVIGFFSTALFTLPRIYNVQTTIVVIKSIKQRNIHYSDVYSRLLRSARTVITLDE